MAGLWDEIKQGYAEEKAEQIARNTPISYWCTFFDDCVYSPREFYALVEKNLDQRHVPDLVREYVLEHEGSPFSPRRLYFHMRRERIVAQICAAPFGTGFFVSSRLFDHRQFARYWDYIHALIILLLITIPIWAKYGTMIATVVFGIIITTLWSLMRLASDVSFAALDEKLASLPVFGQIYESWFHPDTYYRQDQQHMYREAVNRSVQEAVAELTNQKGIRPLTESQSRPILAALR